MGTGSWKRNLSSYMEFWSNCTSCSAPERKIGLGVNERVGVGPSVKRGFFFFSFKGLHVKVQA